MLQRSKLNRLIVAGIAAAAIAPTAAVASPAIDGGPAATQDMRRPTRSPRRAGTGVTQDMRAPDQVDGADRSPSPNRRPGRRTWAVNPQPIPNRRVATTSAPSADGDGIDAGVLIALGGGALLLVGGLGVAGRKRLQVVRQRQLA